MTPFKFSRVENQEGAMTLATSDAGAKYLAGGTNLVDLMKMGVENPGQLVDINSLPLQSVDSLPNGGIRIGALVRNSDLAYNATIRRRYPVLSEALLSGASPQLRNMATVGGNLMQRTRCPYFYDVVFACNKREPESGCAALKGYNRNHAILGTSGKCVATHPSDMCVALAALDAIIHVQSPGGERTIPLQDFHLLPGETPQRETALEHGELITAIDIPDIPFAAKSTYLKVRDRSSFEFALSSAAVALDIHDGIIDDARIALGGVATKPWRATSAERLLKGSKANEQSYQAAAAEALREAKPLKFNEFKIELATRTLVSALRKIGGKS